MGGMTGTSEFVIDLDKPATVPDNTVGLHVREHSPGGQFVWNRRRIHTYCAPAQHSEYGYKGPKLREELRQLSASLVNANFIDFVIPRPELLDDFPRLTAHAETLRYYAWGTEYFRPDLPLLTFIRCFYFDPEEDRWREDFDSLSDDHLNCGWRVDRLAIVIQPESYECVPPHSCRICAMGSSGKEDE